MDLLDGGLMDLGPSTPTPADGLCHVCRTRTFRVTCRACGRGACASDLWTMFGLCRTCVPDDQMALWQLRGELDVENWLAEGRLSASGPAVAAEGSTKTPDGQSTTPAPAQDTTRTPVPVGQTEAKP